MIKKMWLNFSTQNEPMNRTYAYDKVNMSSYQMIDNARSIDDVDLSEQGLCKWLHSLFLLDFMLVALSFHFYFHQLIILGMLRKRRNFWVAAQYILWLETTVGLESIKSAIPYMYWLKSIVFVISNIGVRNF